MAENKLKHLEFIQNVITRMNGNSFLIKGWTITLASALFALAAKDANLNFILISYFGIIIFWILDGFYLSQERQYRELYGEVANKAENLIDFNMDASAFNKGNQTWINGILSKTIGLFYGILIILTLIVICILKM